MHIPSLKEHAHIEAIGKGDHRQILAVAMGPPPPRLAHAGPASLREQRRARAKVCRSPGTGRGRDRGRSLVTAIIGTPGGVAHEVLGKPVKAMSPVTERPSHGLARGRRRPCTAARWGSLTAARQLVPRTCSAVLCIAEARGATLLGSPAGGPPWHRPCGRSTGGVLSPGLCLTEGYVPCEARTLGCCAGAQLFWSRCTTLALVSQGSRIRVAPGRRR